MRGRRVSTRRRRAFYDCCVNRSRGKHEHGRRAKAHDHATGTGFAKDRSTTRAVLKRMEALGAW